LLASGPAPDRLKTLGILLVPSFRFLARKSPLDPANRSPASIPHADVPGDARHSVFYVLPPFTKYEYRGIIIPYLRLSED